MNQTDWVEFRRQMPITRRWAYFDHAAVGPLPARAHETVVQWARQAMESGDTVWPQWNRRLEEVRARAAGLLGASTDEIAFVPSTTAGISLVADGYPWQNGDNVVTLENEFPSNLYPWLNLRARGVETRRVSVDRGRVEIDALRAACDDRTRVVAISWVGYASGFRIDVGQAADVAHACGALLMLDAIQGVGVHPIDVQAVGVDFLSADGHKWMLGPEGAGLFYAKQEHLDRLRPLGVGWHSVQQCYDFAHVELKLKQTAARYEGGSHNTVGLMTLGASLDLLAEFGLGSHHSALEGRVLELAKFAAAELQAAGATLLFDHDPHRGTGILTFSVAHAEPMAFRKRCLQEGIVVSCRGGGIRISLHAYNNEEEIQRLVSLVANR